MRPFVPLVPAGIAHYLTYTRLHVPPYHWYYGPSLVAATLFFAATATAAVRVPARVVAAGAVAGCWWSAPGRTRPAACHGGSRR
ncbi:hypothetical protein [Amycolatopsis sp. Hca4]|uniref:hypothetical protein n=1 Tax=Amycolatopsis sp. Hca4 TaxID=2742131 RepID=UPI00159019A5|nr:hypothetical protein [Amycolatopsis sp. Hca4]QKV80370.1 hypothetical protein HUT10_46235 [Amycolatopsis sp. Hca4]